MDAQEVINQTIKERKFRGEYSEKRMLKNLSSHIEWMIIKNQNKSMVTY